MNFKEKSKEFLDFYHENYMRLTRAGEAYNSLLKLLTSSKYSLQSVSFRVKDANGCIEKFRRKYLKDIENTGSDFLIKDYITDMIDVRIVCLYNSDIIPIGNLIREHFEPIGETNKSELLDNTDNQFGYRGLHLDLKSNEKRSQLPEYENFNDFQFEVQIRSIIQDAWSVLDHKIKYKKSNLPPELKRSINRLAALFEIADNEFLRIRKETEELEKSTLDANFYAAKTDKAELLNVFNFQQIIEECFADAAFRCNPAKTDEFLSQINTMDSNLTKSEFVDILGNELNTILDYSKFQQESQGNLLNPITKVRHALYLHNKEVFSEILFKYQKKSFDEWLITVPL
jgi:putative GTP pyrophosphokinase